MSKICQLVHGQGCEIDGQVELPVDGAIFDWLGDVAALEYVDADGNLLRHDFDEHPDPAARTVALYMGEGKLLIAGAFSVTERGIEDNDTDEG